MTDTAKRGFVSLAKDTRPDPRTPFDFGLHKLLDDLFAAYPTWATHIGYHAFDDRWPDPTDSGRHGRLAMLRHHRARLQALPEEELSNAEKIDRGITLEAIDSLEFNEAELREPAWDPLSYVYTAGSGLFNLLGRDFAPWEHRGTAFAARLRALPEFLDAAVDSLTGLPGGPVSLLHTDTALTQLGGIEELVNEAIAEADRRVSLRGEPDLSAEMRDAGVVARQAADRFRDRLANEVRGRAQGEGRLGSDLFQKKLHHTLSSNTTYEALAERARRDYDLVRGEMLRLAREAWDEWLPDEGMPKDQDETIRRVLDAIARQHQQPSELIEWCAAEVGRLEDFIRERGIVGLPDDPMKLTWTPIFMRAYGGAFLESPGALDKGLSSYFWITPPDERKGSEAVESLMREDNDRMLQLLCIHEGIPGHYLQLAWANRSPHLARAVFGSGLFAEGWAVYSTQVMMDLGYGDHEKALTLVHWKFYLRAITNAIMDIAIHTAGMTEDEGMALMVGGGFQEESEARAKWLRARLTSTQLCTYYTGAVELWDLEETVRRRKAVAAGATEESVPQQHIAGGLGETPGFDYRAHLESVLSYGSPPIKWVSRILLSQASAQGAS